MGATHTECRPCLPPLPPVRLPPSPLCRQSPSKSPQGRDVAEEIEKLEILTLLEQKDWSEELLKLEEMIQAETSLVQELRQENNQLREVEAELDSALAFAESEMEKVATSPQKAASASGASSELQGQLKEEKEARKKAEEALRQLRSSLSNKLELSQQEPTPTPNA